MTWLTNSPLLEWNFARQNGCAKAIVAPSFLAVQRLWKLLAARREHRLLELLRSWHLQFGNTYKTRLGRQVVMTIEPKNVQAILAVKFKDFDLGDCKKAFQPLLGQGIFASDGSVWEHSRALLRPNFVRNQIADIAIYEKHVAQLIKHIPRDGSTVDLQDLFFQMVWVAHLHPLP